MNARLVRELGLDVGARRERKFAAMLKALSTSAVTLLVAVAGLGACVDAKKRFDEYDNRVPVVDASTVDRPPLQITDITGDWYLALTPINYNNTLHLFVTWTLTISGDTATLTGSYQPLSAPTDGPPTRLPVGTPLTSASVSVDETATFSAPVVGTFDGMANPITGSPLGSQVTIVGTIKSASLVCGSVTGTVCIGSDAPCTPGASVEPATFAAVRVTGVNALPPLPPLDRCPASGAIDAGIDAP